MRGWGCGVGGVVMWVDGLRSGLVGPVKWVGEAVRSGWVGLAYFEPYHAMHDHSTSV